MSYLDARVELASGRGATSVLASQRLVCGPGWTCTSGLILIRDLHAGLFPQDGTCDLGERCTAGDRCEPLSSDGMWTRHARSRGGRRPAWRTLAGKAGS